jgi:hypothetical protein
MLLRFFGPCAFIRFISYFVHVNWVVLVLYCVVSVLECSIHVGFAEDVS